MSRIALITIALLFCAVETVTAIDAEARNLLGRARDAARSDRNGEAAELFGKALQLEPKYRHEVIREYADQLTYSGKAAEAVPLYREAVAEEKITKQEKRKAQLGLGLALSWSKQHDESLLVYEQLLKINNKDFDARVGKARALAVADRNAEAVKAYEALIAQFPKRRTEVLREYAEQLTYSKRLPAAITTFREIIRDNPVSTKEGRLARLGLGLALAWDKQLDAALSVYDQLLEHNPRDAEAEMGRARGLSAAGRNAEAAALFKSIVEKYPEKRRQLLKEAADQMTYAHEFEGAFSVYRELLKDDSLDARARVELQNSYGLALSWNEQWDQALQQYDAALAADSKNITARLGRARVLAALKRQGEAKREYERVLKQDPRNAEALRGLGRLQSWRGRQRDAQAQLRDVLHEHPDDAEAAFWLAQAQSWMGRPDAAEATLHKLLELHPRHQVSRQLLEDLEWRERPQSDLSFQYSTQSDDLEIFTTRFQQDFFLRDGAMMLGPRFDWIFYQPRDALPKVSVQRPGMFARNRFNDWSELTGNLFFDIVSPENRASYTEVTFDTYLTLWPNDTLRFDLGANRTTFDNVQSLLERVTATYGTFSMDITPDERFRFSSRANYGEYSDGNSRAWWQMEAERRLWRDPKVFIGLRYTGMTFARQLNSGYYNPKELHSVVATSHIWGHWKKKLYYNINGAVGFEQENPAGTKPVASGGLQLSYVLNKRWEWRGWIQYFSSAQAASGGFSRTTFGGAIRYVW